jgi:ribonucleotide reductase beta subunit family protein with ferritin-like domain
MPGLTFSELISRDEALHTEFAVLMYSRLNTKLSQTRIYEIIKDAVEIEKEFITDAIPCRMIGMNSADDPVYRVRGGSAGGSTGLREDIQLGEPFDFMELISIESKTNFFEKRVSEYSLSDKTIDDNIFDMSAAF